MRAAINNPYLDTLGGGERYTMAFANALIDKGYEVDVEWKSEGIREKLEGRFGIDLKKINIVKDTKRGDGYDVMFWVSDGSIPILRSRHNFLHFQIPFTNTNGKSLINKMKLFRVEKVICNSYFTKKVTDKEYGINSAVIYPPVDTSQIKPKKKYNTIVSIGRFSQLTQAKRQDVLVKAFKKLCNRGLADWRLILAGGSEVGGINFVKKLRKASKSYPIEIVENPKFEVIRKLYSEARVFWSASGYGVDEEKEPKGVEHFGITVVEAMAAGAVPVVYSAGGHQEIVEEGVSGFLWRKEGELVKKTIKIIQDKSFCRNVAKGALLKSKVFSYENFNSKVFALIK